MAEFPPLLPDGLHAKTLDELQELCVTGFPLSSSRGPLMDGFRRMVAKLEGEGIQGDMLTDGSFLTQKLDPRDVDIALDVSEAFLLAANQNTAQANTLNWFGSDDAAVRAQIHTTYGCHCFLFCDVPPGHQWYPGFDVRAYWLRQFGRDRNGNPKGIGVVPVNGGKR